MTLLVIPNYYGRVTNLRIPGWVLKIAVGTAIAILAVSTHLFVSNLQLRPKAKDYEKLKADNRRHQQEIMRLKQEAETILDRIQALEELDRQVRELVDLPPRKGKSSLGEGAGSVGGGGIPGGIPGAVDSPSQGPQGEKVPGSAKALDSSSPRALDSSVDESSRVLREVATDFDRLNALLEQQVVNLERLKTLIISRRKYLAALPTRWPVRGIITSRFGYRRSPFGGGKEFHDGLDIAASIGTPVVAAGNGRVIFASWLAGYGRSVIIDHGYGYRTQYSHASSILVRRGETVKKGELIARVGSTGRSTGPHLHFMISVNGKLVDPLGVLP